MPNQPSKPPKRVLCIDDDSVDAEHLRRLIGRLYGDCEFIWHPSIPRALEALGQGDGPTPDVILLDHYVGAERGIDALMPLRQMLPYVAIVLLTGQGGESLAVEAIHAGASDYLAKAAVSTQSLERTIRNAVDRCRMKEALAAYRSQLEESHQHLSRRNEEIEGFYHTLSHELKTPLTSIREFISIVLDGLAGDLQGAQGEYLGIALESCDQLTRCMNDLFDASRLETGKLGVVIESSELYPFLQRTVAQQEHTARQRGVTLELEAAPDLGEVEIDENRIRQVLFNLIGNALKFTEPGGRVTVSAHPDPEDEDQLLVEVRDTGKGIPPDHLARIFDRLYQVEAQDGTELGGLGIGLSLSQQLVGLHGSRLEVRSEVGVGSSFHFRLSRSAALCPA